MDTEGDNLWRWKPGKEITTENTLFIPRFQELCEKYGFYPVYLTDYEMAMDERWVQFAKQKAIEGKCEIGMHLHGWNTPPEYTLEDRYGGNPYVTEYPAEIIEQKVITMMDLLQDRFKTPVISHRSGRWATNDTYFDALVRNGIRVDCSIIPGMDLSKIPGCSCNCGNNYRKAKKGVYEIYPGLVEVPMTARRIRYFSRGSIKHRIKTLLLGDDVWLRPIPKSAKQMKTLTQRVIQEDNNDYLEMMIHSSELMPGGSPYFKTQEDIENMYRMIEDYFRYVSDLGYTGELLKNFSIKGNESNEH